MARTGLPSLASEASRTPDNRLARGISVVLLVANVVGAAIYVQRASYGWPDDFTRQTGSYTAEPFIWFMAILPVVVIFGSINALWATAIVSRWKWRNGWFWAAAAAVWVVAVVIDFAHH